MTSLDSAVSVNKNNNILSCFVKSNPAKLETKCRVILPYSEFLYSNVRQHQIRAFNEFTGSLLHKMQFSGVMELQGRVVINTNGRNSCPCTCCQSGCSKVQEANQGSNRPSNGPIQQPQQPEQQNGQIYPNAIIENQPPVRVENINVQVNPEVNQVQVQQVNTDLAEPRSPSGSGSISSSSGASDSPEIPVPETPAPEAPFEPKSTQTSPTKKATTSNSATQTLNNFAVTLMSAANLPTLSLTQEVPDVALWTKFIVNHPSWTKPE